MPKMPDNFDDSLVAIARIACKHSAQAFSYLTTCEHVPYGTQSYQTNRVYHPSSILLELARLIRESEAK